MVTLVTSGPQCCFFFDDFVSPLVDEDCRSLACFSVSRDGPSPQFFLLCSPSLVDRDKVFIVVFELVQLLDEPMDPVVAGQRARVFLDHRECDRVMVFVVESLCVGWVAVVCVGPNVVCSRRWFLFHSAALGKRCLRITSKSGRWHEPSCRFLGS